MRIQIILEPNIKAVAEAQARTLGYPSLATMLRVIARGIARDYQGPAPLDPIPESQAAQAKAIPESTTAPDPAQFSNWPSFFGPKQAKLDPQHYQFLIDQGFIS